MPIASLKMSFTVALATITAAVALPLQAQSYPVKPVKLVIGVAPGGSMDAVGRIAAKKMADRMGQPWYIENRPGASFQISLDIVAKAPGDGYTLLVGSSGGFAIAPALYAKLPYDTIKDFSPVGGLARGPYILLGQNSGPGNVRDLTAQSKGKPGAFNYAHSGDGTGSHLAGELFKSVTGADLTPVPFKAAPTLLSTMAGGNQVHYAWVDPQNALLGIHTGKLKAVVVASKERSALLPDVPTMAEFGYKDYEASGWFGIFAPGTAPVAIANRLSDELQQSLQDPDVREKILNTANEPWIISSNDLRTHLRGEIEKWGRIVKATGITVN